MKTIALDVMGNDNGPKAAIEAAISFVSNHLDYKVILVGDRKEIIKQTKETERLEILDVPDAVGVYGKAREARNGNTSMAKAINLVKIVRANAVYSAGPSGIYLAIAILQLKRIEGVRRPAFMPIYPTVIEGKRFLMLDSGANVETTAENLVQWAKLGSAFAEKINKIHLPKVGIVNIGLEKNKGKPFHKEADLILSKKKNINYVGFVEPRTLLDGNIDVAVVDGYGGNLILKTMEGTLIAASTILKKNLKSSFKSKLGALLSKKALMNMKEQLDYRNYAGAWVLGVDGLVMKTHGSADKKAYLGGFRQIYEALENDALNVFKDAI